MLIKELSANDVLPHIWNKTHGTVCHNTASQYRHLSTIAVENDPCLIFTIVFTRIFNRIYNRISTQHSSKYKHVSRFIHVTSSNGNAFRVTGPFCGEFIGYRWMPLTKARERSFDVFFDLCLNQSLSKQSRRRWFETTSGLLWHNCNVAAMSNWLIRTQQTTHNKTECVQWQPSSCRGANFVIPAGTEDCHKHNLWLLQWPQNWCHGNSCRSGAGRAKSARLGFLLCFSLVGLDHQVQIMI